MSYQRSGIELRAWPVLSCLLLSSCGESSRPSIGWNGTIDTLANGVIQVRNPEAGVWAKDEGWLLVEELRIGSISGDGPDGFGEVAAVGVSPGGLIHVIDGQAQEVRVFAPSGTHVRTFGRRGGGPGEFKNAYGLNWDKLGRLWITDPGNSRYSVYDTAGSLLFDAPRTVPGVIFPWLGGTGRDGFFYDVAISQSAENSRITTYYRVDANGTVPGALPPIQHLESGPAHSSLTLFYLTPRTAFAFDERGYLWVANTGDYEIIQRSLTGDTVRIITRAFTKTPVSQEERDSIAKQLQTSPPEDRNPPIPTTRPALERLFVDPDGVLYVRGAGREAQLEGSFDVFDPEGRFLGTMRSDVNFVIRPALPRFVDGKVYGVTKDTLGVSYVVRARVERQPQKEQ